MQTSLAQVIQSSDVIFVAVKPQYVSAVLREGKVALADRHVVVSIAAGITLATLKVGEPRSATPATPAYPAHYA